MEVMPKRCQVVVRKIHFGEKAMYRCVVPIKRLKIQEKNVPKPHRGTQRLSHVQLQTLRVLLQKLKLSKDNLDGSIVVPEGRENRDGTGKRMLSAVQLQKLKVLLRKLKLKKDRSILIDDRLGIVTCPFSLPVPIVNDSFRVLLRRLKLTREIRERPDHTIFIDKELGFVTNPYLIPGYHHGRLIHKPHHSVLKFGRRSRARRCHVRIRKLQL